MSYVVESDSTRRAKKRRRTAITLIVVVLALAAAAYYAASYWRSEPAAETAATPTCTPTPAAPAPAQITVNVYNATNRTGLAAATANTLGERGFVLGTIANDPLRKTIPQSAEVRFGPAGEAASTVVLGTVPGAVPVNDARADASLDLVLGEGFTELAPPQTATPTPTPTC